MGNLKQSNNMEILYIIIEVIGVLLTTYTALLLACIIIFGLVLTGVLFLLSCLVTALVTQEEYEEDETDK